MKPFYLGLIPARGGSKRIPRKNLVLAGRKAAYFIHDRGRPKIHPIVQNHRLDGRSSNCRSGQIVGR